MQITSIKNRKTSQSVCSYYLNKGIDINSCVFEVNKPLKIKYCSGSFFTHENIEEVINAGEFIQIITTKKLWTLK